MSDEIFARSDKPFLVAFNTSFRENLEEVVSLGNITSDTYLYGKMAEILFKKTGNEIPKYSSVSSNYNGFVRCFYAGKINANHSPYDRAEFAYLEDGNPIYLEFPLQDWQVLEESKYTLWIKDGVSVFIANFGSNMYPSLGGQGEFRPLLQLPLKLTPFCVTRTAKLKIKNELISRIYQEFIDGKQTNFFLDIGVDYGFGDIDFEDKSHTQRTYSPIHFEFEDNSFANIPIKNFADLGFLMKILGDRDIHPMSAYYFNPHASPESPIVDYDKLDLKPSFEEWLRQKNKPKKFKDVMNELYSFEMTYNS